jgi:hypothetical protein
MAPRDSDAVVWPLFRRAVAFLITVAFASQDTALAQPIASATGNLVTTQTPAALVERFKNERFFWRQKEVARAITSKHDASVLPLLADWLGHAGCPASYTYRWRNT